MKLTNWVFLIALMVMQHTTVRPEGPYLSYYGKFLSGGYIKPELESKIRNVFHELKLEVPPIRKASEHIMDKFPGIKYSVFKFDFIDGHFVRCYYLYEDFLLTLTDEELRAAVVYDIYAPEANMRIEAQQIIWRLPLAMLSLYGGVVPAAGYWMLLEKYDLSAKWPKKSLGAVGVYVVWNIALIKLMFFLIRNNIFIMDEFCVTKGNCRDGYIGYLKKQVVAHPELEKDKQHLERIAQLEKNRPAVEKPVDQAV